MSNLELHISIVQVRTNLVRECGATDKGNPSNVNYFLEKKNIYIFSLSETMKILHVRVLISTDEIWRKSTTFYVQCK